MATPQALCIEIDRHQSYLAFAELGMVKLSKRARNRRENYIDGLKQQLMAITEPAPNCDGLSDTELLEEIFG